MKAICLIFFALCASCTVPLSVIVYRAFPWRVE